MADDPALAQQIPKENTLPASTLRTDLKKSLLEPIDKLPGRQLSPVHRPSVPPKYSYHPDPFLERNVNSF